MIQLTVSGQWGTIHTSQHTGRYSMTAHEAHEARRQARYLEIIQGQVLTPYVVALMRARAPTAASLGSLNAVLAHLGWR